MAPTAGCPFGPISSLPPTPIYPEQKRVRNPHRAPVMGRRASRAPRGLAEGRARPGRPSARQGAAPELRRWKRPEKPPPPALSAPSQTGFRPRGHSAEPHGRPSGQGPPRPRLHETPEGKSRRVPTEHRGDDRHDSSWGESAGGPPARQPRPHAAATPEMHLGANTVEGQWGAWGEGRDRAQGSALRPLPFLFHADRRPRRAGTEGHLLVGHPHPPASMET